MTLNLYNPNDAPNLTGQANAAIRYLNAGTIDKPRFMGLCAVATRCLYVPLRATSGNYKPTVCIEMLTPKQCRLSTDDLGGFLRNITWYGYDEQSPYQLDIRINDTVEVPPFPLTVPSNEFMGTYYSFKFNDMDVYGVPGLYLSFFIDPQQPVQGMDYAFSELVQSA